MNLVRAGNEEAFAELVRRYSPRVFHIASRFFRQHAQIEEVAQEIFFKLFNQLSHYEGRGSFEGWLTKLATNLCLNILRKAKQQHQFQTMSLTSEEAQILETQLLSDIRQQPRENELVAADLAEKLLQQMSADDRLVLMFIDGEGLSIKEVAELTQWSEAKVKVKTFRARRRMRELLEKLLGEQR